MMNVMNNNIIFYSPLEQFAVFPVLKFFTNSSIFLIFTIFVLLFFFATIKAPRLWLPTKNYLAQDLEILNEQLMKLTMQNLGGLGQKYYNWLFFCFLIVAGMNMSGMIPYAFTVTSHIVITLTMSIMLFVGLNIRAMKDQTFSFMALFLPSGTPAVIKPFLVVIELISYIARAFSLAIRLFANMMAGHTLLKILIGFVFLISFQLVTTNWMIIMSGLIPFGLVIIITVLEVTIAMLQAYVFTVLLCLYIKDLHTSH